MIDIGNYEKEMEELFEQKADLSNASSKPDSFLNLYNNYLHSVQNTQYFALLYFYGFKQAEINSDCSDNIKNWVKQIDRKISSTMVAGVISVFIVSSLEEFIITVTNDLRMKSILFGKLCSSIEACKKIPLEPILKPSSKKKCRWISTIQDLFNLSLENCVVESICSLLKYRNDASHQDIRGLLQINGETMKVWILASYILMFRILKSADGFDEQETPSPSMAQA